MDKICVKDILRKKRRGEKITMLTAYDYPLATLLDRAGIDVVLVGDSLANVVLGLESTREVGMNEMIHHAKAVRRGVAAALLIGDMPFGSYRTKNLALKNAKRFVKEAGCDAVKLEWSDHCAQICSAVIKSGIPVMGHVGLTPQTAKKFTVRGKDARTAKRIISEAKKLEEAGCFSVVLECIPEKVAQIITNNLKIPTIGIGAGIHCDGQVLVTNDLLGLFDRYKPRFVKQYADVGGAVSKAVLAYRREVLTGKFPAKKHTFAMAPKEALKLK